MPIIVPFYEIVFDFVLCFCVLLLRSMYWLKSVWLSLIFSVSAIRIIVMKLLLCINKGFFLLFFIAFLPHGVCISCTSTW